MKERACWIGLAAAAALPPVRHYPTPSGWSYSSVLALADLLLCMKQAPEVSLRLS